MPTFHPRTDDCPSGKRGWDEEIAALRELRAIRKLGARDADPGGRERRVYRCNLCGRWHLTRRPDRHARTSRTRRERDRRQRRAA